MAQALQELKTALTGLYGERLRGIYLFGSYARGDFHEESDVDVLVVLCGEVHPYTEIVRINEFASGICLEHDLLIAVVPAAEEWFNRRAEPLYQNVAREGVLV